MLVQREIKPARPLPAWLKEPPRKRSDEYYDLQVRVDSETPLIDDSWLYEWADTVPSAFTRHSVIFRQYTPAEVIHNGWTVLKPAVGEMRKIFGMPKPIEFGECTSLEWLALGKNDYDRYAYCDRPCFMGVYGDQYVVAASGLLQKRQPFVPYRMYRTLHDDQRWQRLQCRTSYRHFRAHFDAGYFFHAERQNLPCAVSYGIDVGVHSIGRLWATLEINGVRIPTPSQIRITTDFSKLPSHIEHINTSCFNFVRTLGSMWLREYGTDEVFALVRLLTHNIDVPKCVLEMLQYGTYLEHCRTRLEVLCAVMKAINLESDVAIPTYMSLAQNSLIERKQLYAAYKKCKESKAKSSASQGTSQSTC